MDDVLRDVPTNALAWRQMHAKPWCCIDLDHATPRLSKGLTHICRNDVDPRDIQADNACDAFEEKYIFGMNSVRDIDRGSPGGDVGRGLQVQVLAFFQDSVQIVAGFA